MSTAKKAANRPLKYAKPTVMVSMRVPKNKVDAFKKMAKKWLKKYQV